MKKLMAAIVMSACIVSGADAETYQNPVRVYDNHERVMDAADPFVMRFNGKYYLYTTGAEEIRAYESADLVNWRFLGHCTRNGEGRIAFAPEVFYWRGDFYMITSPSGNGHYIMKSASPEGPFDRITPNFGFSIDGSLFAGDDGTLYMLNLSGNNSIAITEIDENTMTPKGINKSTGVTLYRWTEGPGVFRRGDWSYLTFTGNHYLSTGYRVAWASRKGDMRGKYMQADDHTLLIKSEFGNPFTGLGHSSNFYGPDLDSLYTAYHAHALEQPGGGLVRWYNIDRLLTNGGKLYSTGPTMQDMPVPAMPDFYGYADGETGHFKADGTGYFAHANSSCRFTQECNFILNGGCMAWRLGTANGEEAIIECDGKEIRYVVGGGTVKSCKVPELGENGKIHTLRIECTEDVLYAYIDTMRLLTAKNPAIVSDVIGAARRENVSYSYIAHTDKALGDGDFTFPKAIPGAFSAIHAVNGNKLAFECSGDYEEKASRLDEAAYVLSVQEDSKYAVNVTYRKEDAGKKITFSVDGGEEIAFTLPQAGEGKGDYAKAVLKSVFLPKGTHGLVVSGEDLFVKDFEFFRHAEIEERAWDISKNDRKGIITLGGFTCKNAKLSISTGKTGFALIGNEGMTDYEMAVSFEIPQNGAGFSGIVVNATDVSYYPDQVPESAFGYGLALSNNGITIKKLNYGAPSKHMTVKIPEWKNASEASLIIRVQSGKISVFLPGEDASICVLHDENPYTHGLCGLFSTGKELSVTALSVKPLKEE